MLWALGALCALSCNTKPKAAPEVEPDPSAWLAPPDASGLAPVAEEPDAEAPAPAPDDDGVIMRPVRKVRAKDMPPLAPAPTERGKDPKQSTVSAVMASYGFPVHESLKHLCGQRVYEGGGGHLTWDAFTSTADPAALLVSYRGRLGENGFSTETSGGSWKLPPNATPPSRVLSILPAAAGGPHRGCSEALPADAKSVILASRRH